jgi:hypothetical protein
LIGAHSEEAAMPARHHILSSNSPINEPSSRHKNADEEESMDDKLVIMDSDNKSGGSDPSVAKYSSLDDRVQTPVAVGAAAAAASVVVVTAVAPADLPAGYRFTVIDDANRAVVVEVVRFFLRSSTSNEAFA